MSVRNFDGRVVVVTGAARGIGDAIALAFAEAGAKVYSLDLGKPDQPRAGVTDIETDVSNPDSVRDAFAAVDRDGGGLDVLVSNAGIQRVGLIGRLPYEQWSAVINTHLTGYFLCASEVVPRMLKQGRGGAIVAIASTAAFMGLPGRGPYCAAKAGILGLTRAMSQEVATSNIRVNAVAPGYTRTKFIEQGLADGSMREDWMLERVPMKRLAGPAEIADAVLFLAGDKAAYVTGQTLVVDGGWTVQGTLHAPDWLTARRAQGMAEATSSPAVGYTGEPPPARFNMARYCLAIAAATAPDKVGLIVVGDADAPLTSAEQWTYRALDDAVRRIAAGLSAERSVAWRSADDPHAEYQRLRALLLRRDRGRHRAAAGLGAADRSGGRVPDRQFRGFCGR